MKDVAVILLAAGASTRLGSPKQLIDVDGEPLVRAVARQLLALSPVKVLVIVGAEADLVRTALSGIDVTFVVNDRWAEGMGTSIACGINAIDSLGVGGVMIALCDQPAIPARHYEALCARFAEGAVDIVVSEYAGTLGVPAVLADALFPRLGELTGDRGAKSLFYDPALRVVVITCDEARIDLDTSTDVHRYRSARSTDHV